MSRVLILKEVIQDMLVIEWKPNFLKKDHLWRVFEEEAREVVFVPFETFQIEGQHC